MQPLCAEECCMHEKKHGVAFGMVIDLASIVILLILQVINAKIVLIKISDVSKTGKDYTEMKSSLESGKVSRWKLYDTVSRYDLYPKYAA